MPSPHPDWLTRWQQISIIVTPDPFPPDSDNYNKVKGLLNALDFHFRKSNMKNFDLTLNSLKDLCSSVPNVSAQSHVT